MALAAGTRLGPYEILEPLGAGGMGEVHRACNARIGRDVAIKVLPAELASDPQLEYTPVITHQPPEQRPYRVERSA